MWSILVIWWVNGRERGSIAFKNIVDGISSVWVARDR
jgi:hypothetical protein